MPGLSGTPYQRQKQLYERLGSPLGPYQGSYQQNIWLLGQIQKGNIAPAPASAPVPRASLPSAEAAFGPAIQAAKEYSAGLERKLAEQRAEEEALFGQYEVARKAQEPLPDIYKRLTTEAGIPGLQEQISGLSSAITNVKQQLDELASNVIARTRGAGLTEAQRQRVEAAEREPLALQAARLGTALSPLVERLGTAISNVQQLLGLTAQQQEREMEPLRMRIEAISDRFSREITGYNQGKQAELDALLQKLAAGWQLSVNEWNRAQELAAEERNFARQKQLALMQLGAAYPTGRPTNQTGGDYASAVREYEAGRAKRANLKPMLPIPPQPSLISQTLKDIADRFSGKTPPTGRWDIPAQLGAAVRGLTGLFR